MKPPEEVKRELALQWLQKADDDLAAARHLLGPGARLAFAAAFHAQQAAEKALKAVLVWHQTEFRKTHNMEYLINLVRAVDEALAERVSEASALTPYGVEARYPAELPNPTLGQVAEAVAIAERVRNAVLQHLPRSLRPPGGPG